MRRTGEIYKDLLARPGIVHQIDPAAHHLADLRNPAGDLYGFAHVIVGMREQRRDDAGENVAGPGDATTEGAAVDVRSLAGPPAP